ncbi:EAL domain-containing protein [Shewanella sp. C32]|uniref:EAL domain-containing protein n=1 Tax=Shewanella electrica TaxID=515560 RepID=A0ABT2FJU1_9GAMM|nr:EAL domain-containing protein [Shewanella electrica]MCH1924977.1 EAL domain-containing protein [Shewanella electrica]MCS4556578.1 EAL domain-containing protein [Shewanella electrica]
MSLRTKLLLTVFSVFAIGFILMQAFMYQNIKQQGERELLNTAQQLQSVLMASQSVYQQQFVASGLPINQQTLGFLPAHALSKIAAAAAQLDRSGFSLNNVAAKPRDSDHQADAVELSAIEHFRHHPEQQSSFTAFDNDAGQAYYLYAQPIHAEASCLECHGAQADAPAAISEQYATDDDYQLGDVMGIVSIKLPADMLNQRMEAFFISQLIWLAIAGTILALLLLYLNQRNVSRPLNMLNDAIRRMEHGVTADTLVLEDLPGEFKSISRAFNQMVEHLNTKDLALKESETRYRTLVTTAQEGVIQTDQTGRITFWNHGAEVIFGYKEQEILGHSIATLVPQAQRAKHNQGMQRVLSGDDLPFTHKVVELTGLCKDGSERRIELTMNSWMMKYKSVFVAVVRDVTERKQAEEQIRQLAYYDPLTELPNRRMLMEQFRQALNGSDHNGQYGAILMADLDNFKSLNDTFGHGMGDKLLVEVAKRIRAVIGPNDTVSRLGGDEFIVLLGQLGKEPQLAQQRAMDIAREMKHRLARPYRLASELNDYSCTVSIGGALFQGTQTSIDTLMTHVDMALYKAKDTGRDAIKFFDASIQQALTQRNVIESALKRAEALQQFHLCYQPQMDARGKLIGAEALLRWTKEDGTSVPPSVFIPVAEDCGLIESIGAWVIKAACSQLVQWQMQLLPPNVHIAINVSAKQFTHVNFVSELLMTLSVTGADPHRLKIELTESAILQDIRAAREKILRLKAAGIQFSLDDFGTGYSSLAYLKQLPVDQLKIDQSFVRDIHSDESDAAIVQAILAICESLNIEAIAEGVETREQLQFLLKHGCRRFQGYLLGRPVSAEQFVERYLLPRTNKKRSR